MDATPTKRDENDTVVDMLQAKVKLKTASKEPPTGPEWLSSIKTGSEFLTRDIFGSLTPRFLVLEWIHGGLHQTGNVLLIPSKTPNDTKTWQWVDPVEFCKVFEYRGTLYVPTDEETEEDYGDG